MSGSGFIDAHTYCTHCGDPVRPGEYHRCNFGENFTPSTTKFLCRWCKNWAQAVPGKGTTKCSVCEEGLHGAVANGSHTVMHFAQPQMYINELNNNWSGYNTQPQFQTYGNMFGTRW
ncbi:hypothetical protein [Bandra megavirus]|uniref:Uncharacterized protein n=1 Tax=Bandra megavirus TaxID=2071566 RepID=A0A2K9V9Z0_9VIRU|nr:hypothetical protein [Bandra megavirus]